MSAEFKITVNNEELKKGLKDAEKQTKQTFGKIDEGINNNSKGMKNLTKETEGFTSKLKNGMGGITSFLNFLGPIGKGITIAFAAVTAGVTAAFKAVSGLATKFDATAKAAKSLNMTTTEFALMRYASRHAGVEIQKMQQLFLLIEEHISKATKGEEKFIKGLRSIGLEASQLEHLSTFQKGELFFQSAYEATKSGKGLPKDLLNMFEREQRGTLQKLAKENYSDLIKKGLSQGAPLNAETAKKAEALSDALANLDDEFMSLVSKSDLLNKSFDILTAAANKAAGMMNKPILGQTSKTSVLNTDIVEVINSLANSNNADTKSTIENILREAFYDLQVAENAVAGTGQFVGVSKERRKELYAMMLKDSAKFDKNLLTQRYSTQDIITYIHGALQNIESMTSIEKNTLSKLVNFVNKSQSRTGTNMFSLDGAENLYKTRVTDVNDILTGIKNSGMSMSKGDLLNEFKERFISSRKRDIQRNESIDEIPETIIRDIEAEFDALMKNQDVIEKINDTYNKATKHAVERHQKIKDEIKRNAENTELEIMQIFGLSDKEIALSRSWNKGMTSFRPGTSFLYDVISRKVAMDIYAKTGFNDHTEQTDEEQALFRQRRSELMTKYGLKHLQGKNLTPEENEENLLHIFKELRKQNPTQIAEAINHVRENYFSDRVGVSIKLNKDDIDVFNTIGKFLNENRGKKTKRWTANSIAGPAGSMLKKKYEDATQYYEYLDELIAHLQNSENALTDVEKSIKEFIEKNSGTLDYYREAIKDVQFREDYYSDKIFNDFLKESTDMQSQIKLAELKFRRKTFMNSSHKNEKDLNNFNWEDYKEAQRIKGIIVNEANQDEQYLMFSEMQKLKNKKSTYEFNADLYDRILEQRNKLTGDPRDNLSKMMDEFVTVYGINPTKEQISMMKKYNHLNNLFTQLEASKATAFTDMNIYTNDLARRGGFAGSVKTDYTSILKQQLEYSKNLTHLVSQTNQILKSLAG